MNSCKDWGFRDQIQRAAVSIMNNIAEGSESGSDAKFYNFLNIAKGSCGEVRSMLYLCEDFQFCSIEERISLQTQLKKISTGIVKLQNILNTTNSSIC
ncbi:MAG: four helix bundle protein [Bacteroidaceae bacterium]|nr:four helix bundle protein [Bacteroidaceae bacterium]